MNVRIPRLLPIALGVATILAGVAWISRPSPVSASTESSMASAIVTDINTDRGGQGLRGLRVDPRLTALAADRAMWMASTGLMSHSSVGGEVYDAIAARGVDAWSSAEAIGSTNATWGNDAAQYLYSLWRGSQEHWDLMMSSTFNYIGVGIGYRPSTGETFASVVLAEAPDVTNPVAQVTGVPDKYNGMGIGARACELADTEIPSIMLDTFGRPPRVQSSDSERNCSPAMSQALALLNGDAIQQKLKSPECILTALLKSSKTDTEILDQVFLSALARHPSATENTDLLSAIKQAPKREEGFQDALWALLNSKEFLFNH